MTRAEAKKQAKEKYIELWGKMGPRKCGPHILLFRHFGERYVRDRICRIDTAPAEYYPSGVPKIWMGGNSKPNHRTVFLFDLKAGTMEITEHF